MQALKKTIVGLVLAGGESKRMGEDKGLIDYNGIAQRNFSFNLLKKSNLFQEVFISVKKGFNKTDDSCKYLEDNIENIGPLAAVYTALTSLECDAVFVIATDMPNVKMSDITKLIESFKEGFDAISYVNNKGYLEPMFAIYTKSIIPKIEEAIESEIYSLTRLLKNSKTLRINIDNEYSLENINTPEEKELFFKRRNN